MATLYCTETVPIAQTHDSDPYSLFICWAGIRVRVRTRIRVRQCKEQFNDQTDPHFPVG